jgi:mRNA-degrading endonuclease RelE of RelBE toxin-antitoxin system
MRFLETPVFTRAVEELLDDDQYHALQIALLLRPDFGRTIRRSGGLRKVRWSLKGKGKRGGVRVIYFWDEPSESFYMLYIYPKSEREDLTAQQLRILSRLVREEFG